MVQAPDSYKEIFDLVRRLELNEKIILGGETDVAYVLNKLKQFGESNPTMIGHVKVLEARVQEIPLSIPQRANPQIVIQQRGYRREEYIKNFRISPEAVDLLGEQLSDLNVIYSNYYSSQYTKTPFVGLFARPLPESLTQGLESFGYAPLQLAKNTALAMFVDLLRVRKMEVLAHHAGYLDKAISEFVGSQAGNHGKMYFLGPQSDHEREIKTILSPGVVQGQSSLLGMPVDRGIHNLIGTIPEECTLYRNETIILVNPKV